MKIFFLICFLICFSTLSYALNYKIYENISDDQKINLKICHDNKNKCKLMETTMKVFRQISFDGKRKKVACFNSKIKDMLDCEIIYSDPNEILMNLTPNINKTN